ncbi:hypothetical protein WJX77_002666 [Trebouxia sp. C0004]
MYPSGDTEYTMRDLRHHLCGPCLAVIQPQDLSTKYTGELSDIVQQAEAKRRQDKNASKQRGLLASRAAALDSEKGCASILLHLSRAGVVTFKVSKSVQRYLDTLQPQQQVRAQGDIEQAARLLKQLSDVRDAAGSIQQGRPASNSVADAQRTEFDVPKPSGMPDRASLVSARPAVPTIIGARAAQPRPRSDQSRPAPTISEMCPSHS